MSGPQGSLSATNPSLQDTPPSLTQPAALPPPNSEAARLDAVLERFDQAWRQHGPPDLDAFLFEASHPQRRQMLASLAHIDLEHRLGTGLAANVEQYLTRYPELAWDQLALLDLIAWEFELRRRREPGLQPEEYVRRFPHLARELRGRLDRTCPPRAIAGYQLLGELGKGGMGVVYQARQVRLNRIVALKMIRSADQAGAEERLRFLAEAEAVAALAHPGIVQVYEFGTLGELPYFAMEFCAGGSLADRLAGTPLPPPEAARLVEKLARTLYAVHQRGIVHRDLKPGNVLLDAEGSPKVTDFGLARRLESGPGLTVTGVIVGTPSYMAPEQAAGGKEVSPSVDIYALGAILYECLTGRPPFRAATVMETLRQVISDEPVPVRRLQPNVPADLETICLKCLRKEAGSRYATAGHLADDLRRFLDGEPINARPVSAFERAVKWVRKRPPVAALIGTCLLALVVLAAGLAWGRARAQEVQARALVDSLAAVETARAPDIIEKLGPYRRRADPHLRQMAERSPPRSRPRLHAALALLPNDPDQDEYLYERLLDAEPQEVPVIRQALYDADRHGAFIGRLWDVVEHPPREAGQRLRAAYALALYDPENERWAGVAAAVVQQLVSVNPTALKTWTEGLKPARLALLPELAALFRDRRQDRSAERTLATGILADFAADRPEVLTELLKDADRSQYATLWPRCVEHREAVMREMERELERPAPSGAVARDAWARRQAQAAVTLLRLGDGSCLWPLLKHQPEPYARGHAIELLGPLQAPPGPLLDRLSREKDDSARRALVLALGQYDEEQLPRDAAVAAELLGAYRDDPDPGIHSALDWLLRQRWRQSAAVQRIDEERAGKGADGRRWVVNGQGQTLAVVRGPVEFVMGSPEDEPDRHKYEAQHRRRIPRSFALATKEVTVAQFKRFLAAHPEIKHQYTQLYSPDPDSPIISVTWYEAAKYCRWLSEQEKVPEDQMCYPPVAEIKEGMKLPADFLTRTGYRLPTEAEWEYAARAGAATSRCYGGSEALLGHYAWYLDTSKDRTWPVGRLKPNDLGLFDILGNAWEWCHDASGDYRPGEGRARVDAGDPSAVIDTHNRLLRGSGFNTRAFFVRSAYRNIWNRPSFRSLNVGLRVARTVR